MGAITSVCCDSEDQSKNTPNVRPVREPLNNNKR